MIRRLIDADKLKERFMKQPWEYWGKEGICSDIDKEPTADQWNTCNERLPEQEKDVQVQLTNGLVFQGFVDENGWNLGCSDLMCLPINCVDTFEEEELEVIAWRPLPQPYKGGR